MVINKRFSIPNSTRETMPSNKMSTKIDFPTWLADQLAEREWSQSDLARHSGLSRASISEYINRKRSQYDAEALRAIAHALKIPPEEVFRAAGLLPAREGNRVLVDRIVNLLLQLSPEAQEIELRQIRAQIELQEEWDRKDAKNKRRSAET